MWITPQAAVLLLGVLVVGALIIGGLVLTGCLWREGSSLNRRRDRRQGSETI